VNFLSMFSGIDAASVAWAPLGWRAAAFCEIEPFPSAVLAHHYPNVPNLGDVTKADLDAIGPLDLAVFGSPCQSYSVAGKRLGLDDPRGNLALFAGRIIYRKRPRWFTFENVPGLLSSDGGWDFGTILAAFAGYPSGSVFAPPSDGWGNAGVIVQANANSYGLAWRILDAQYFGVPQRRRRVFVVGHLGDWRRAAAVLFERHSLSGHPAPRREKGQAIAGVLKSCAGSGGWSNSAAPAAAGYMIPAQGADFQNSALTGDVSGTLLGEAQKRGNSGLGVLHASTGDVSHCLNAGGMGRQDYETETLIAHSLRGEGFDASEDGTGWGTPIIPILEVGKGTSSRGQGPNGAGIGKDGDPMFTLQAGAQHAVCFTAKDHGADASDISPTLRSGSHSGSHANGGVMPAVAFAQNQRDELRTMDVAGALAAEPGMKQQTYIAQSAVRRLTPRECERLQGFPEIHRELKVLVCSSEDEKNGRAASAATGFSSPKSRSKRTCGRQCADRLRARASSATQSRKVALVCEHCGTSKLVSPAYPPDVFARLLALTHDAVGRSVQRGRAESPASINPSSHPSNGSASALLCGREIAALASDAGSVHNGAGRLHEVHHIGSWARFPELRLDTGNLSLLCFGCHKWVHSRSNAERLFLRT
jgi:DNA (cytosine-5)-methyltransferase 1